MRNATLFCRRPRALGVVAAALSIAAVVGLGSAAAATSTKGGSIHVIGTASVLGGSGLGGSTVITGAIGDTGTSGSVTKNGKFDATGHYAELSLTHGTMLMNKAKLDANVSHAWRSAPFNSKTCSIAIVASATLPVVSGTGRYKGISGRVNVTLRFGLVLPRYTRGAHAGQCNKSSSAHPTASLQTVDGTGRVKFS